MLSGFFEWLASTPRGAHEVSTNFMVFATLSLLTFAVQGVITGRLVVDTWKALRDERRARRLSASR